MKKILLFLPLCFAFPQLRAQGNPVQFTAKKEKSVVGTVQTVAIRVADFTGVTTVQFTLQWPSATFQFTSVSDFGLPDLDATHFNTTLATSGKLTFSWDDVTTQGSPPLSPDAVLFRINFNVLGPVPPGATLDLSPTPTPTEVTRLLKVTSVVFNNENLSGCNCN
ncbi:MAG: hypothetical protein H7Z75_03100 [Ferruginibacter sp.]|nr:hypothetical protein [Cytophagales bacterium]